jgi:hypothetical protein
VATRSEQSRIAGSRLIEHSDLDLSHSTTISGEDSHPPCIVLDHVARSGQTTEPVHDQAPDGLVIALGKTDPISSELIRPY